MAVPDFDPALAALDRLLAIAQSDTGQSRRVANFLLAWWNTGDPGGFEFTDLWNVDRAIADDILAVTRLIFDTLRRPDRVWLWAAIRAVGRRLAAPPVRPTRGRPALTRS